MDISGPVRGLLRQCVPPAPPTSPAEGDDALAVFVHALTYPDQPIHALPRVLAADAPWLLMDVSPPAGDRPVHRWLALAGLIRLLPRVGRGMRDEWRDALARQVAPLPEMGQKLLVSRATPAWQFLWHYWLMVLARDSLRVPVPELLIKGMWRRAWAGQARGEAGRGGGHLHPLTPETGLEGFVYDEFCAVHAAYGAIVFLRETEWIERVEAVVKWHVANTQPDNTTTEPWGLAAFASLDDTGTFAAQQVHDATTRLTNTPPAGRTPVTLALLADALLTQEEAAGV